ncbi:uncharacterized protein METZ01_LOCUS184594 [marine metagenome]|uniref:Uncharacterized protein n=1 Tax=marine metagenome TaxID=408172 RepID=A0A382CZY1_9ZZZZ
MTEILGLAPLWSPRMNLITLIQMLDLLDQLNQIGD